MHKAERALEGFTVLIDTREQRPLAFTVSTERATLPTADYSCRVGALDLREQVAIERKSISDLCGCIGGERERFERCLERLAKFPYRALVIEGDARKVALGDPRTKLKPQHIMGSLMAWGMKHQLPITFMPDRAWAARWVERSLFFAAKYIVLKS